jgi:hypothetical protein
MRELTWKIMPGVTMPGVQMVKDFLGDRELLRTRKPLDNAKGSEADLSEFDDPEYQEATHDNATLVTSRLPNGNHMVAIDIDRECMLVPTGTEGHYHLYVNVEMTKRQYFSLLNALTMAGVIEAGFYAHAVRRGRSFLRYPGVTKKNEAQRIEETEDL